MIFMCFGVIYPGKNEVRGVEVYMYTKQVHKQALKYRSVANRTKQN